MVIFGQCWLLPRRASGCLLNWKHTLQLQPRGVTFLQMVLVLWFSMWAIWLITTSFVSRHSLENVGSLDLGRNSGVSLLRLLAWDHLSVGWRRWRHCLIMDSTDVDSKTKSFVQKFIGEWSWKIYIFEEVSNECKNKWGGEREGLTHTAIETETSAKSLESTVAVMILFKLRQIGKTFVSALQRIICFMPTPGEGYNLKRGNSMRLRAISNKHHYN